MRITNRALMAGVVLLPAVVPVVLYAFEGGRTWMFFTLPEWLLILWLVVWPIWLTAMLAVYVPGFGLLVEKMSYSSRVKGPNRVGPFLLLPRKQSIEIHVAARSKSYDGRDAGGMLGSFRGLIRRLDEMAKEGDMVKGKRVRWEKNTPIICDTWIDGDELFRTGMMRGMGFEDWGWSSVDIWLAWAASLWLHVLRACHERGDWAPLRKWMRGPRRRVTRLGSVQAMSAKIRGKGLA